MSKTQSSKSISCGSDTVSTTGEASSQSHTLFIFDFDDTLFCTKYFDTFSLSYQDIFSCKVSLEETNPSLVKEVKELENSIIDLLVKLIQSNYDIVIVSNADMKWINNCLTHFLPELKDFIEENELKIYSAKNLFSNLTNKSVEWKVKAFKKTLYDLYGKVDGYETKCDYETEIKAVIIGDGLDEKKAVFRLKKETKFTQLTTKFIQMILFPSAASIILELKYIEQNFVNILAERNKSMYKMVIEIKNNTVQIKCVALKKKKSFEEKIIHGFDKKKICDFDDENFYLSSDTDGEEKNLVFLGKKTSTY